MKHLALALALVLVLAGCGESKDSAAKDKPAATKTTAKKEQVKPKFDKKAYAKSIETKYVENNGRAIQKSCDADFTNWQCYYDGIEAKSAERVDISLSTPGDISANAAKAFSKKARTALFNFVGPDFKNLETVVTFVNGTDTGTTYRRDVDMLNK